MSNVLIIVVLKFTIFIDKSRTSDLFSFRELKKSILNTIKKNMPKDFILILVLYFGKYKKHQKYRIFRIK